MSSHKRNDPCWCGSGLKYKMCHLRREDQTPENPFKIRKNFFDLQKQEFCFCELDAENCSDVYAASHSISKSGSLKLIAERSHVAAIEGSFHFVGGSEALYKSLRVAEISANKASTFRGFCSFHDAKLFAQLDRLDFRDPAIFFWQLFYRAVAYEKYSKIIAVDFSDQVRLLDKGANNFVQQQVQFEANLAKWSNGEGLKKLDFLMKSLESIWEAQSLDQISYSYFLSDRRLPFAGVGCFQPSMNMDGHPLQRVNLILPEELFQFSPPIHSVCIAAIPMKLSTLLSLCCLRREAKATQFMASLSAVTDHVVDHFLGAMMLSIENVFFTPSYLRALNQSSISVLKRLFSLGIAEDVRVDDIRIARSLDLFKEVSIVERVLN